MSSSQTGDGASFNIIPCLFCGPVLYSERPTGRAIHLLFDGHELKLPRILAVLTGGQTGIRSPFHHWRAMLLVSASPLSSNFMSPFVVPLNLPPKTALLTFSEETDPAFSTPLFGHPHS